MSCAEFLDSLAQGLREFLGVIELHGQQHGEAVAGNSSREGVFRQPVANQIT